MIDPIVELKNLEQSNEKSKEEQENIFLVDCIIQCDEDAQEVLLKAVTVMKNLLSVLQNKSVQQIDWSSTLPTWFTKRCSPEMTSEQADEYLKKWQSLSPEGQAQLEREQRWSLDSWIYWFEEEERTWYWWSANIDGESRIILSIQVPSWPTAIGSLVWLFKACGAKEVNFEN